MYYIDHNCIIQLLRYNNLKSILFFMIHYNLELQN